MVKVQNITKEHKYNSKCQLQNKYFPFAFDTTFCGRQKKIKRYNLFNMFENNKCFNKRCNDHKCSKVLTNLKTGGGIQNDI